jgi:hypothetical protein
LIGSLAVRLPESERAPFPAVRPYFPYARVKQGILDTAATLFHLQFRQEPNVPAWDPAVETWDVIDGDKAIGRFYLDMHARPGKYSQAEMSLVLDGIRGKQLPEAILVCNFPAPAAGGDCLTLTMPANWVTHLHRKDTLLLNGSEDGHCGVILVTCCSIPSGGRWHPRRGPVGKCQSKVVVARQSAAKPPTDFLHLCYGS